MNEGRLVFTQAMDLLHREQFERCVSLYPMPRTSRSFSARDQFLSMAFAQMTFRESLRDIEACLRMKSAFVCDGHPGQCDAHELGLCQRAS